MPRVSKVFGNVSRFVDGRQIENDGRITDMRVYEIVCLILGAALLLAMVVAIYRAEIARRKKLDEALDRVLRGWARGIDWSRVSVGEIDCSRLAFRDGAFVMVDESVPVDERFVAVFKTLAEETKDSKPICLSGGVIVCSPHLLASEE